MASEEASTNAAEPSGPASASGISFSFTRRSGSGGGGGPRGRRNVEGRGAGERGGDQGEGGKDLVFSLEGGNIHSSKPVAKKKEYVVPLILKTVWRKEGEKEGEGERGKGGGTGASTKESVKTESERALDKEAAEAIVKDLQESQQSGESEEGPVIPLLLQNKPPVDEEANNRDELADLHLRPEASTAEEYEEMPIGEFGAAMLKGMGWKHGESIGKTNKGMIAPIEFIPRMGKTGLGAAPKPQAMPDKKRIRKPGETERKVQGPYIGADGRVKHMRLIGVDIPEQPVEGFNLGNFARVLRGPHVGLCGKIMSTDVDNSRVALKLAINGQVIDFSQHHLELVSKEEYKRPAARQSSSKEYGLIRMKEERDSSPSTGKTDEPSSSKSSVAQVSSDSRDILSRGSRDKKRHTGHSDLNCDSTTKRRKRDDDASKSTRDPHSEKSSSSRYEDSSLQGRSRERLWVAPKLRVKIVDTKFMGGRYYNSKVVILDVVSGDQCMCQTAEGRYLEGVRQGMLETVVPKIQNAAVMIVAGKKHRGQIGRVLERDTKNYKATVEMVYTSQVLTVDYDDVCEYTGDIEDL